MAQARRVDALAKIAGRTRYLDDERPPESGTFLHGALVCSSVSRARILEVLLPARAEPGSFTIVTARDIPGRNLVPEPVSDQPFLADTEVFYAGQPILAVAHESPEELERFVREIRVRYEELPAVTDTDAALEDTGRAFGTPVRLRHRGKRREGIEAESVHRGVYSTSHQEQAYLEPQAAQATYRAADRSVIVSASLQCPYYVKEAVEAILGPVAHEVIVRAPEGVGGGFGGKEDFPNLLAGIAALLAWKAGLTVRIVLDRAQDVAITTKRHPSRISIESACDRDTGELRSLGVEVRLDAGAYQTLSPVVLSRAVLHASGGYCCPDVTASGSLHRSDTPPNGAFRGFGAPQAIFAVEAHLERIASELHLDPYLLRRANVLRSGDELPTGQKVASDGLFDCLERVVELSGFREKREEYARTNKSAHDELRGIGLSLGLHGGGFTGNGERRLDSEVKLTVSRDGAVEVGVAAVDMGQGPSTTLAELVASAFRHPLRLVTVPAPDTSRVPNSGPTVASRTAFIVGTILTELCERVLGELGTRDLGAYVRGHPDLFPREWRGRFRPPEGPEFDEQLYVGDTYRDYSWVASVSEIRYEIPCYRIVPWRSWTVLDVGRVVNRDIALGQVEGGVVQAWGWALSEVCYRPGYGRIRGFTDYALPMSLDVPEIHVEFIHTGDTVARGLGEIPMDCPAASIRNALFHATGLLLDRLPLTPETILAAWESRGRAAHE